MKNRKSIIALLLVAIIGIVGLTVAYFSNSTSITNEFETSEYGTDVTETFTSPTGWQPGDETPKVLTVKNTGEVDEAVRVKVEEKWVNKNGQELSLTQDGNVAALIHYINDSDWTRVDVANEDYYYYYYNYKLAPEEETSELLDKVIFNPLINASTTCTTTTENGVTTRSCQSNGSGYDGATYTLKFTIETVQYNKYADAWNTGSTITLLDEKPEPPKPASEYLAESATNAANAEYNDSTKGKMFQFSHTVNGNTVNEARYIGDAPNNYVYFNCDEPQEGVEYNYASSCEVWRILGVFDVERTDPNDANNTITETRMKLVRGEIIKNDHWNTASNGNGYNDWTADNATLKLFLNGDYYNRTGDAATYGLKASAKSIIGDAVYYLGAANYSGVTTEQLYTAERGNTTCGVCNSDTTKLTWTGIVGLMYPSDEYMVYGNGVNATCYSSPSGCSGTNAQTGWVYNSNKLNGSIVPTWLLSSSAGRSNRALYVLSGGYLGHDIVNNYSYGVRPVVYLKSNIKIADGTGEETDPYKLSL